MGNLKPRPCATPDQAFVLKNRCTESPPRALHTKEWKSLNKTTSAPKDGPLMPDLVGGKEPPMFAMDVNQAGTASTLKRVPSSAACLSKESHSQLKLLKPVKPSKRPAPPLPLKLLKRPAPPPLPWL